MKSSLDIPSVRQQRSEREHDDPLRITPKGYIEVEGIIAGSTYSFLLDTGAFVSILEPKIRERNHLAFNDTRVILTAPYAGIKEVRLTQATVPGFRIGSQDLSDFRIGFAESHTFDPGFRHEYTVEFWDRTCCTITRRSLTLEIGRYI
ncbi:MAG TPA: retropepsin-like aspartic protease [Chthoniobacterales bacterium]|nr:retropepsin-like aspartic protease [Chthoniobacterales bacterium]